MVYSMLHLRYHILNLKFPMYMAGFSQSLYARPFDIPFSDASQIRHTRWSKYRMDATKREEETERVRSRKREEDETPPKTLNERVKSYVCQKKSAIRYNTFVSIHGSPSIGDGNRNISPLASHKNSQLHRAIFGIASQYIAGCILYARPVTSFLYPLFSSRSLRCVASLVARRRRKVFQ